MLSLEVLQWQSGHTQYPCACIPKKCRSGRTGTQDRSSPLSSQHYEHPCSGSCSLQWKGRTRMWFVLRAKYFKFCWAGWRQGWGLGYPTCWGGAPPPKPKPHPWCGGGGANNKPNTQPQIVKIQTHITSLDRRHCQTHNAAQCSLSSGSQARVSRAN